MLPTSPRARYRLLLVALAVATIGWLLWSARHALAPFLVAIVAAFLLAPLVDRLRELFPFRTTKPELAIGLAVGIVYAAFTVATAAGVVWLVPRVGAQARQLIDSVPDLVAAARERSEGWLGWYRERVPASVQQQVDQSSQQLAARVSNLGLQLLGRAVALLTGGVGGLLAYVVVPFWLFFVLKDRERGLRAFRDLFPPAARDDVEALLREANRTFGAYLRAQAVLATFSAVLTATGLWWFGIPFALVLGVVAGLANLIPVIGPMIGGLPALVVAIASRPGWSVLWVFLFLFVLQNLKAHLLVPRIQGHAVRLHPAIVLVLLPVAGALAGFWGLLLVVPVAAVARDVVVHIYRRLGDEVLGRAPSAVVLDAAEAGATASPVVKETYRFAPTGATGKAQPREEG